MGVRTTQTAVEALVAPDNSRLRATQTAVEVLVIGPSRLRATQTAVEVLTGPGEIHQGTFEMGSLTGIDLVAGRLLDAQTLQPVMIAGDPVTSGGAQVVAAVKTLEMGSLGEIEFVGEAIEAVLTTIEVGSLGGIEFVGEGIRFGELEVGSAGDTTATGEVIHETTLQIGAVGDVLLEGLAMRQTMLAIASLGSVVMAGERTAWVVLDIGALGALVFAAEVPLVRGDVALTESTDETSTSTDREWPLTSTRDPMVSKTRARSTARASDRRTE